MTRRMLIDAFHPEEIRVAITSDGRLEEFDFETTIKKQNKGNIYLAKVTRVEPSLQAAFVEYGGNRQGFLPFAEIHYDYYQIPIEDKKRLEEEADRAREKEEAAVAEEEARAEQEGREPGEVNLSSEEGAPAQDEEGRTRSVSQNFYRKYKIQEVIKRGQVILLQVIKDERGNKGASLTTYISIPGRYCVLMPKNDKQGGVSRKIRDFDVRKKLRKMVKDLEAPKGMSVIIRTAGSDRTKAEIKRDFNYLLKLWEKIREYALKSNAPALIYEESDIIKRAIRDLFDNDMEEVIVEGEDAYNDAKNFMKLISPSQSKKIKQYKEIKPVFLHYEIEEELNYLYDTEVPLKSGGYVVINPTEALVSIDVNSGKSTRERNVEQTALKTNLEAAREIARQLKLRDLAGLIVVDFIDMLDLRNKKAVERKLKDELQKDRAKIQVGRISSFGLLEMSRQRLGSSFVEASTLCCPRCNGLGRVRSKDSAAVMIMRTVEFEARQEKAPKELEVFTSEEVGPYIQERMAEIIARVTEETGVKISIISDRRLMGAQYAIGKAELEVVLTPEEQETAPEVTPPARRGPARRSAAVHQDDMNEEDLAFIDVEEEEEEAAEEEDTADKAPRDAMRRDRWKEGSEGEGGDRGPRRRRGGRGRRGGRNRQYGEENSNKAGPRPEDEDRQPRFLSEQDAPERDGNSLQAAPREERFNREGGERHGGQGHRRNRGGRGGQRRDRDQRGGSGERFDNRGGGQHRPSGGSMGGDNAPRQVANDTQPTAPMKEAAPAKGDSSVLKNLWRRITE